MMDECPRQFVGIVCVTLTPINLLALVAEVMATTSHNRRQQKTKRQKKCQGAGDCQDKMRGNQYPGNTAPSVSQVTRPEMASKICRPPKRHVRAVSMALCWLCIKGLLMGSGLVCDKYRPFRSAGQKHYHRTCDPIDR